MIIIIQGLVILFAGALENMFRPAITTFFATPGAAAAAKPDPASGGVKSSWKPSTHSSSFSTPPCACRSR
jgi:hypothetical protein